MKYELEFEKPLSELADAMERLRSQACLTSAEQVQLERLRHELLSQTLALYAQLTTWQTVQVARHKNRPYAADYIRLMCEQFFELHGDRAFADDQAIIGGLARMDGRTVMFVGHQKGRSLPEKRLHNYGMPHPEGFRKAHRLMQQAEKFDLPLICLIDTPGAFPSLEDEERGQAEAIASNLYLMSRLHIPIIAVVIGEGGSGGALSLSVADRLLMLEHSIYTVAAPEAAASILWRSTTFAPQAAEAMRISARELLLTQIIDDLVTEPVGGAHQNHQMAEASLKRALLTHLNQLQQYTRLELVEKRYRKYREFGLTLNNA